MTRMLDLVGRDAASALKASIVAADPAQDETLRAARREITARWAMHNDDGTTRWCRAYHHAPKLCYRTEADALAADTELATLAHYRRAEAYLHKHHWHLREALE
jgi:hypothetical protein